MLKQYFCERCDEIVEEIRFEHEWWPGADIVPQRGFCRHCFAAMDSAKHRALSEGMLKDFLSIRNDIVTALLEHLDYKNEETLKKSLLKFGTFENVDDAVAAVREYREAQEGVGEALAKGNRKTIREAFWQQEKARKRLAELVMGADVLCMPALRMKTLYKQEGMRWYDEIDLLKLKIEAQCHRYNIGGSVERPYWYPKSSEDEKKYFEEIKRIAFLRDFGDMEGLFYMQSWILGEQPDDGAAARATIVVA